MPVTDHPQTSGDLSRQMDAPGDTIEFTMPDLFSWLELATAEALDTLPFGLIAMAFDGTVEHYNLAEAKMAGLTPARVVGRNFESATLR